MRKGYLLAAFTLSMLLLFVSCGKEMTVSFYYGDKLIGTETVKGKQKIVFPEDFANSLDEKGYRFAGWKQNGSSQVISGSSVELPYSESGYRFDAYIETDFLSITSFGEISGTYALEKNRTLTDLTIPASINGITVTSIAEKAFDDCDYLESVTIPDTVKYIEDKAFWFTGIRSVTIPASVIDIGYEAFYQCMNLSEVHAEEFTKEQWLELLDSSYNSYITERHPVVYLKNGQRCGLIEDDGFEYYIYKTAKIQGKDDTVTSLNVIGEKEGTAVEIGSGAFRGYKDLTAVTIENGVTAIGDDAFRWCTNLTSITIPESVTYIGNNAFAGCNNLTSINIPDSVTCIGIDAFSGCSSLASIIIPDSVTDIGGGAFSGCTSLTEIAIPDSVTAIDYGTFEGCTGITSIRIPDSVTAIGSNAFAECNKLESITIPNGVGRIYEYTFRNCDSITEVLIPDSVTRIDHNAFESCDSLTSMSIPDTVVFFGNTALADCDNWIDLTIRPVTNAISEGAFQYNRYIKSVTILDGITTIEAKAFSESQSIAEISIPDTVTSIGDYAFYRCWGIRRFVIPASVVSIGNHAFTQCYGPEICIDKPKDSIPGAGWDAWNPTIKWQGEF